MTAPAHNRIGGSSIALGRPAYLATIDTDEGEETVTSTELARTNGDAHAIATTSPEHKAKVLEGVLITGDLKKLSSDGRVQYYRAVCESVGLNPLTQPFEYVEFQGRLQLYARKNATDQLRSIYRVSVTLGPEVYDKDAGTISRTATATMPDGRRDEDLGVVHVGAKKGEDLANARMKAATKAKRRVTLSLVGLSFLDETELETVRGARMVNVDPSTGEILGEPKRSDAYGDEAQRAEIEARAAIEAKERADADALASEWIAMVDGCEDQESLAKFCYFNGAEWHSMGALPSKKNAANRVWTALKNKAEALGLEIPALRGFLSDGGIDGDEPSEERKPPEVYRFKGKSRHAGKLITEVPDDYLRELDASEAHPLPPATAVAVRNELLRRGLRS